MRGRSPRLGHGPRHCGDHEGGRHHGRGRHGGRRALDHGELRLVVLSILAEAPRHGYELMREIEERSGGAYAPSPGAIYPTLYWSEDTGLAEVEGDGGSRKRYAVTEAGRAFLAANGPALDAATERLGELRARSEARRRKRHAEGPDPRVAEVLAAYHERIEQERAGPKGDLDSRLLAVGPNTGRLINLLARSLDAPTILEIGTSYGYSGIWLGEAARATGGRLVTMELSAEKAAFAAEMAEKAGLSEVIEFRVGDAVEMIAAMPERVDFVLMDLWNHLYEPCLGAVAPKLSPGAIIVADNIRAGDPDTLPYLEALRAIPGMRSLPLPVGSGLEVSRYLP